MGMGRRVRVGARRRGESGSECEGGSVRMKGLK